MLKLNVCVMAVLLVCGGLACGGGSGGSRTGSGGTTGTGGTTTGSGGSGFGTGGAGGGVGYPCVSMQAPGASVTDFTDGTSTGRWGTAPTSFTGGTFSYANTGGSLTSTIDLTAMNFHLAGTVMGYAGGGLYFDVCTGVQAYTGVQFTIAGDKGTCALELQIQTNSDKLIDTTGKKGTCTTGCVSPAAKNLVVAGTAAQPINVSFASLMGGAPVPFDVHEIVGLQWQVTSPTTCTADFTIDNIVWTN